MAKTPRKSPGIGHNSEIDSGNVLRALATEILDQKAMEEIRERRKRNRKRAEGNGVPLAHLDRLYRMRDEPLSEVENFFRQSWAVMSAFFKPLREQYDLFAPKPEAPERQAAARHAGLMAGVAGLECKPPPNLSGDDQVEWTSGWHEGNEAFKGANKELADVLADALKNAAAGKVTDGTGKAPKGGKAAKDKAAEVNAQAAADFKADNPDVKPPGDDGFEATKEELEGQSTRKAVQEARLPGEATA